MRSSRLVILFLGLFIIGCTKVWKDPNNTIPSSKVDIFDLIATPIVYDSAGVRVEGMVWDLTQGELSVSSDTYSTSKPFMVFKLSDVDGNFVNVFLTENFSFKEGDIVEVVGIYRRNYKTDLRHFVNEIEAKNVILLKSLEEKYSKY